MTYAFDTTDEHEDAITYKRLQANAQREKDGLPPFKENGSYVGYFINAVIVEPLVKEFIEASVQPVADDFRAAPYDVRKKAAEVLKSGR